MTGGTPTTVREVLEGKTGKLEVGVWTTPQDRTLVSVASLWLDSDRREYVRKKGGFALTPGEARELSDALLQLASEVEQLVAKECDE